MADFTTKENKLLLYKKVCEQVESLYGSFPGYDPVYIKEQVSKNRELRVNIKLKIREIFRTTMSHPGDYFDVLESLEDSKDWAVDQYLSIEKRKDYYIALIRKKILSQAPELEEDPLFERVLEKCFALLRTAVSKASEGKVPFDEIVEEVIDSLIVKKRKDDEI